MVMTLGLVGKKCGMTRVFTEDGISIPVSVVAVLSNRVAQIKTVENDGYQAIQVAVGEKKASRVNKPLLGHYAKAGIVPAECLVEFPVKDLGDLAVGSEIKVDLFKEGQYVDVSGVSRGKGFAGTIKRHNFTMGDATHGNSLSHRSPGSIGQRQTPGRVFPGKKMSGHMGDVECTSQSLSVVRVDTARNVLLIRGAIPGAPGGRVIVRPAKKRRAS